MSKPWDERECVHYRLANTPKLGDYAGRLQIGCIQRDEIGNNDGIEPVVSADGIVGGEAWAKLLAAAPAMARLLCRLEWSSVQDETGCVVCGEFADGDVPEHTADCPLDAALTAAGIDAAERERVRGGA
jgi:hypothetical protein